ncbi:MAG: hypothetical protein FJZ58_08420 [Chlamydiae bacterium]|nr:hypothetical protein [Chlamydiota bacterium]
MMFFVDALRAQYFLSHLDDELSSFSKRFSPISAIFSSTVEEVLSEFLTTLTHELDQILLPTVAHELFLTKSRGILQGETPSERYQSFFIQGNTYTEHSKSLVLSYPFLFETLDNVLSGAFQNISKRTGTRSYP